MSEAVKTAIFSVTALVAILLAIVTRPQISEPKVDIAINKPLFPDFTKPEDAQELHIWRFDDKKSELSEFEIRQVGGRWVIPSHSNYPADAETQLKEAALCLIDLLAVDVMPVSVEDHKKFGVVEPHKGLKAGEEGVGVLVNIKGSNDEDLAKLIISDKKVEGHADKKFVRKSGEDWVYVVKIDPAKLTTKFSDWIEKDLLKLNAFDVEQLVLKDYSVTLVMGENGPAGSINQRFELTASAEPSGNPSWKLDKLLNYRQGEPVRSVLSDTEELNSQKLDDLKSALDNLEIVDVHRKPKGLSANLKAEEGLFKDREGLMSMQARGFYPYPNRATGGFDVLSANGELVVAMKEGYQYLLRFGNVEGAQENDANKLNRYLLVTAQINEGKFPEPVLEPLPDLPGEEAVGPAKPAAKKEPEPKKDEPKDEGQEEDEEQEPKKDEVKKEEGKKDDEKKADDKKDDAKKVEEKKEPEPPAEDPKKAAERKRAEVKAQRDRIEKENKRKVDEHKANRKKAEEKVRELNSRFAEWYYVISEDVYKKVHLSRVDLIKEKTATKDEGFGVDAFRKLEESGLKKDPPKAPPGGFDGPGFPGLPPG